MTEDVPLPDDDQKLASMQHLVESTIEQKRSKKSAPPAGKQPQKSIKGIIPEDELRDIAHRIRRAIATARRSVRKGGSIDAAKGYVVGRVVNVLQYLVDRDDIALIPNDVRRDYFYGMSYIGFERAPEPIPAARVEKLGLREIESKAGLPAGVAAHGSCRCCGRTLTNPDSAARGIGPECIKKRS